MHKITEDDKDLILQGYAAMKSIRSLEKELSIHHTSLALFLKANGIQPIRRIRKLTETSKGLTRRLAIAYARTGSVEKASRLVGISKPTATKILKANGIAMRKSYWLGNRVGKPSKILKWIEAHPDDPLPRSYHLIADLTGVSAHSAYNFFRVRRDRIQSILRSLPDLRTLNLSLLSTKLITRKTNAMIKYDYLIDKYSLEVAIKDEASNLYKIEDLPQFLSVVRLKSEK